MQIRRVFTGEEERVRQVWSLTRQSLPYVNFNDNASGDDNTVLYLQFFDKYLGFREFAYFTASVLIPSTVT